MKRHSFCFLLMQALILSLLASCNLYMDGDDPNTDETENGDGFTAPKTIEDSLTTVTYQFSDGTKMLDERYRQYITRYRGDSLNEIAEIYLRRNIPAAMLPQRGNYLSTDLFDIFDMGLVHQVDAVVAEGDQIVVKAHRVTMGEVFKKLKISSDFYVAMDSSDIADVAANTRSGGKKELGYKLRPVSNRGGNVTRASAFEKDFDFTFFNLEMSYIPYSYSLTDHLDNLSPNTQGLMRRLSNAKNKIDKSYVKPFGEFDAGLGVSVKLGFRMHFEYDSDEKEIDVHGYIYRDIQAGLNIKEAKGGFCIPLAGWGRKEVKRANSAVGSSSTEVDDYLVKIKTQDIPIPAGPVKLSGSIQPNLVLDLFAAYQFDPDAGGLLYGLTSSGIVSEFGFHDDPKNGTYSYPRDKLTSKDDAKGEDEWNASFAAGIELHAYIDFILKIYEVLQCKMTPELSVTVGYEKSLADRYRLGDFIENGTAHTPAYGSDSNTYLQLAAGVKYSGEIDLGMFWSVDLFSLDLYSSDWKWKWGLYPDFNTTVEYDKDNSTQESSVYTAEVKTDKDYLYTPREAPLLAIYYAPESNPDGQRKFLKIAKASNSASIINYKSAFRYRFSVPGRDIKNVYYAVPVYLTGYGITRQYMYGTPAPFFSTYESLNISGMEQLRVRNAYKDDGTEVFAFKFRLGGVAPAAAKKHFVLIGVYDNENGKLLSVRKFSLGNLPKGRMSRDYAFFFTGTRPWYYVTATYYTEDKEGNSNDICRRGIDVYINGGTEEIDDLRYDFSGESDYYLLQ